MHAEHNNMKTSSQRWGMVEGASRLRALLPLGVEVWFSSYCQRRFDHLSNPVVCVIFSTSTIYVMLAQARCFGLPSWLKLKMWSQLQPIRSFQGVIHVMSGWCLFFIPHVYTSIPKVVSLYMLHTFHLKYSVEGWKVQTLTLSLSDGARPSVCSFTKIYLGLSISVQANNIEFKQVWAHGGKTTDRIWLYMRNL